MSRAIQIRVSESGARTVHVEDGVTAPLEMLPILPAAQMAELLAQELVARGFVRDGGTCKRTEPTPDPFEVTVDLEAATVAVTLGARHELSEEIDRLAAVASEHQELAAAALRDDARREIEARLERRAALIQVALTARLQDKIDDLKRELDAAIGSATIAALTQKAAQLGRIEESHLDEAGNLTIRVRV